MAKKDLNCTPRDINFGRKTLLTKVYQGSGCNLRDVEIKASRNDNEKKLNIQIIVKEEGRCDALFFDRVWLLVDKVPLDYMVNFEQKNRKSLL